MFSIIIVVVFYTENGVCKRRLNCAFCGVIVTKAAPEFLLEAVQRRLMVKTIVYSIPCSCSMLREGQL